MNFTIAHTNINVRDLSRSLAFYDKALGLKEARRITADDFTIVFLTDGTSAHLIELTCLNDHADRAYDLGENESHICFVADDYEAAHALHKQMGCICYENDAMGLYFIEDPDGYWLEIVPKR